MVGTVTNLNQPIMLERLLTVLNRITSILVAEVMVFLSLMNQPIMFKRFTHVFSFPLLLFCVVELKWKTLGKTLI